MIDKLRILSGVVPTMLYLFTYKILPNKLQHYFTYNLIWYLKKICNINVHVHGNTDIMNERNYIYMANHYEGIDFLTLYSLLNSPGKTKTYTIAKYDLLGDHGKLNIFSYMADVVGRRLYDICKFIPYVRGDKNSGTEVKNTAIKKLLCNENILVFPEGRARKNGAIKTFKPGMFKTAEKLNIPIVPITLVYRNYCGKDKHEDSDMCEWTNTDVDIYIHDVVLPQSHEKMMDETFNKIQSKQ